MISSTTDENNLLALELKPVTLVQNRDVMKNLVANKRGETLSRLSSGWLNDKNESSN